MNEKQCFLPLNEDIICVSCKIKLITSIPENYNEWEKNFIIKFIMDKQLNKDQYNILMKIFTKNDYMDLFKKLKI